MEKEVLILIDDRISQVAAKLTELGEQYGPDVIDAALMVVRLNGVEQALYGVFFLVPALSLGYLCCKLCRRIAKKDEDELGGIAFFAGFLSLGGSLIAGYFVLGLWTWVAIFDPKLAVAKRILDGVL